MKSILTAGAVLSAAFAGMASAAQEIGGNWYANQVSSIQYTGFSAVGSYNMINDMDNETGQCTTQPKGFSGSLGPLAGQVSAHFRGPCNLEKFAVYMPGGSSSSNKKRNIGSHKRHNHQHLHKKDKQIRELQDKHEAEKRNVIVATINGVAVSWTQAAPGYEATSAPISSGGSGSQQSGEYNGAVSAAPSTPSFTPSAGGSGEWVQKGYYCAESGTAQGLTFLANLGGAGSGDFSYTFGNSLSYVSSNGQTCAASPEVLAQGTIPSDKEVIIMTDSPCGTGEQHCDYYRPGSVAYQGFDGASKIFVATFSMPHDSSGGFNSDMSAFWFLNADITRTIQYGPAGCTAWPDAGEFDVFEILSSGSNMAKSCLHGVLNGGSSDYFARPTNVDEPITVAVAMNDDTATIKILDSFDYATGLSAETVQMLQSVSSSTGGLESVFHLLQSTDRDGAG